MALKLFALSFKSNLDGHCYDETNPIWENWTIM